MKSIYQELAAKRKKVKAKRRKAAYSKRRGKGFSFNLPKKTRAAVIAMAERDMQREVAIVFPEGRYTWFRWNGNDKLKITNAKGKEFWLYPQDEFGVRPATSKKGVFRVITRELGPSIIFSMTQDQVDKLTKKSKMTASSITQRVLTQGPATIFKRIIDTAGWWEDLGKAGQEAYLAEHPNSEKAKQAQAAKGKKKKGPGDSFLGLKHKQGGDAVKKRKDIGKKAAQAHKFLESTKKYNGKNSAKEMTDEEIAERLYHMENTPNEDYEEHGDEYDELSKESNKRGIQIDWEKKLAEQGEKSKDNSGSDKDSSAGEPAAPKKETEPLKGKELKKHKDGKTIIPDDVAEEGAQLAEKLHKIDRKREDVQDLYFRAKYSKKAKDRKLLPEIEAKKKAIEEEYFAERKNSEAFHEKHGVDSINAWEAHNNKRWPSYKVDTRSDFTHVAEKHTKENNEAQQEEKTDDALKGNTRAAKLAQDAGLGEGKLQHGHLEFDAHGQDSGQVLEKIKKAGFQVTDTYKGDGGRNWNFVTDDHHYGQMYAGPDGEIMVSISEKPDETIANKWRGKK